MNNSLDQIEGIGLIKNRLRTDKYYKIYTDGNFNRYTYSGNFWLSREQISQYDPELITIFDKILFKGKSHLKRVSGISIVTDKLFTRWEYNSGMITRQVNQMFIDLCKGKGIEKELDY